MAAHGRVIRAPATPSAPARVPRCQVYAYEPRRLRPAPTPPHPPPVPPPLPALFSACRDARRAVTRANKTRRLDRRGPPPDRQQDATPPPSRQSPTVLEMPSRQLAPAAAGPPPRPRSPLSSSAVSFKQKTRRRRPTRPPRPPPPRPLTLTSVTRGVCGCAAAPPTPTQAAGPSLRSRAARSFPRGRRPLHVVPAAGCLPSGRRPRRVVPASHMPPCLWLPPTREDVTGQWPRGATPRALVPSRPVATPLLFFGRDRRADPHRRSPTSDRRGSGAASAPPSNPSIQWSHACFISLLLPAITVRSREREWGDLPAAPDPAVPSESLAGFPCPASWPVKDGGLERGGGAGRAGGNAGPLVHSFLVGADSRSFSKGPAVRERRVGGGTERGKGASAPRWVGGHRPPTAAGACAGAGRPGFHAAHACASAGARGGGRRMRRRRICP